MAVVDVFQNQREFRCNHCSGKILVPKDLPPMTGPCPHCGSTITSPGPEADGPAPQKVGVVVEVPAVERVAEPRKGGGPPPLPPVKPTPAVVAVNPVSVAVVEDRSAAISVEKALAEEQNLESERALVRERAAAEKALAEEKALESERALARERAAAIAAEKAAAEEKALAAERALAEQRAHAERAQAVERALAEERALAAEQAHAREKALADERAAAEEKARAMEAALAAERAQAEERARAMEKALEEERTLARERALAQERALAIAAEKSLAEEQARAAERALAAEKALAEAKAQEIERQLAREKALAEEKAAAAEKALALAAERALAAEKAAAAEKALADEKALAEEKARVAERALAEAAEKAAAAERALAQERALAREKALAAEKALAEERALALAAETALAAQKAAAHEQFLAREHEQARAKAQAEEREAARRKAFEAPAPVASPATVEAAPPAEAAPAAEPLAPLPPELATPLPKTSEKPHRNKVRKSAKKPKPAKPPGPASRKALVVSMLVLLVLILGGGGLAIHFLDQRGRQQAVAKRPGLSPEQQALIAEKQYLQSGWQEDAKQVLSEFLAAETVSGKAAFSLRGSELIGTMEGFYGAGKIDDSDTPPSGFSAEPLPPDDQKRGIFMMRYEQPPQFEMRDFFRPLAPLEVQYGLQEPDLLLSSLAKAGNFASEPVKVHAFFKRGPDGLRLDWETFIQTKHRTFRAFTELPDPGRSQIFRLFVVEDVPEKGKEETGMKTYRMIDPAHKTDSVRVDVKVDSELGRALSILNWRGVKDGRPKTRTATLELEWTRDEVPRLALKRFLCWEFLGIGGQGSGTPTGK